MQNELLAELTQSINTQLLSLIMQFLTVGVILMSLKNLANEVVNYLGLKLGDFGRGTKIEIGGKQGHILKVYFKEVEIELDNGDIYIVPVSNFIKSNKVIMSRKRD